MKEKMQKLSNLCLKIVPALAVFMLAISANSTGSWHCGQEELPENAKRYRKF